MGSNKKKQPIPPDADSSRVGSEKAKGSSGPKQKTKSGGRIVKSRYLQSLPNKSETTSKDESGFALPPRPASPKPSGVTPRVGTPPRRSMAPQSLTRVGTPPRRSMAPQSLTRVGTPPRRSMAPSATPLSSYLESTQLDKSILQSTIMAGHHNRPDFDVSAIEARTVVHNTSDCEAAAGEERDQVQIERETFLLAYLTAKMEHNTRKLKAEAEANILAVMEAEEELRKKVQEKKRQHLLREKKRQLNELLDLQIAVLTPVAALTKPFTDQYKSLAAAVDTTRHELPVKNLHIEGDRAEFLDKAAACLGESQELLLQLTQGDQQENQKSLECLKALKTGAQDIREQLFQGCAELTELSSLVTHHTVLTHQSLEEKKLGARAKLLYFEPRSSPDED